MTLRLNPESDSRIIFNNPNQYTINTTEWINSSIYTTNEPYQFNQNMTVSVGPSITGGSVVISSEIEDPADHTDEEPTENFGEVQIPGDPPIYNRRPPERIRPGVVFRETDHTQIISPWAGPPDEELENQYNSKFKEIFDRELPRYLSPINKHTVFGLPGRFWTSARALILMCCFISKLSSKKLRHLAQVLPKDVDFYNVSAEFAAHLFSLGVSGRQLHDIIHRYGRNDSRFGVMPFPIEKVEPPEELHSLRLELNANFERIYITEKMHKMRIKSLQYSIDANDWEEQVEAIENPRPLADIYWNRDRSKDYVSLRHELKNEIVEVHAKRLASILQLKKEKKEIQKKIDRILKETAKEQDKKDKEWVLKMLSET